MRDISDVRLARSHQTWPPVERCSPAPVGVFFCTKSPSLFLISSSRKCSPQNYLPEALPLRDPRKADIKLGHLLAMTSGLAESNRNPGIVEEKDVKVETIPVDTSSLDQDQSALQTPMWTEPGGGYFYSSQGVHVASIVLRHLVGMEMQRYIDQKLAKPMQFGGWGYGMERADGAKLQHTPGGGGIALRATDILRFGYLLLQDGYWEGHPSFRQTTFSMCSRPSAL